MPQDPPEISRTMELLRDGQAVAAVKVIAAGVTADLKEGRKPDPDQWACFVLALLCQGDVSHACNYAERFEDIKSPQLDRIRRLTGIIRRRGQPEPPEQSGRASQPGGAGINDFRDWLAGLRTTFEACSQEYLVGTVDNWLKAVEAAAQTLQSQPQADAGRPFVAMDDLGCHGRFANQIFQYAFLRIFAKVHDMDVRTPPWIGRMLFGHADPQPPFAPEIVFEDIAAGRSAVKILAEPGRRRPMGFRGSFLHGFCEYAGPHKDFFRSLFEPAAELKADLDKLIGRIRSDGTLVCLHLRRGDFGYAKEFPVAPWEWYRDWVASIWPGLSKPVLYIASDEPQKVVPYFHAFNALTADTFGIQMPLASYYPDFFLMSQADHLALANSSFSYAAALLNTRAKSFASPDFEAGRLAAFDPWNVGEEFPRRFEKAAAKAEPSPYPRQYQPPMENRAARQIVPHILHLCQPAGVVHVGCGDGSWLAAFRENGLADCVGLHHSGFPACQLQVPNEIVTTLDLHKSFKLNRTFDLAIALNIPQTIRPRNYDIFIDCLAQLAPVIITTSPIPHQIRDFGNIQLWPSFWRMGFVRNGFVVFDSLRRMFWSDPAVDPYLAQNLLIFAHADSLHKFPRLAAQKIVSDPRDLDMVHPQVYLDVVEDLKRQIEEFKK
ncbi:MAG: alpha-1,2-fucosyltransferase [Planctomycetes bacterium]|nr:alpha-1,2-fucosyltransferase [Planctomycetota bacterium]